MSAPPLVCPRCGRKEGDPNTRGNPIRFNRKRGLCYGCAHSLLKNPDATPWYDPTTAPKTCGRCGREEGTLTQQGQPLTFPGTHSKYANYCHPCIGALRTGRTPSRPLGTTTPVQPGLGAGGSALLSHGYLPKLPCFGS